jgi:tetratricopeptide (TPR) repeat protein
MAVDEKEKHEAALLAVLMTAQEHQIENMIRQQLQPWRQTDPPPPTELDAAVLRGFAAVFRKSGNPQNHLYLLREFYQTTRDFRLPTGLADAVVGHTAGRVYPFLQGMNTVFTEIREEAAVDSIVERIDVVREKATTEVDRRALDLLEVLAERRAAEMLNQPGPHAQKALAAMQRAFDREWTPGEPRLMADFLAHLGRIANADLAAEQLRELQALHAAETPGTLDRLHVAHAWARTLWSYNQDDRPVDLLESALAEYQQALDGPLSAEANGPLGSLIGYLESRGRHTRGEEILEGHLANPAGGRQVLWLTSRLYQLYESALERDGRVSLGSGPTLYLAAIARIQADLEKGDDSYRHQLVNRLCSIFRTVKNRNIADVTEELTAFAFQRFPQALKRQTNNHHNVVGQVADTLHDLIGARVGLKFVIERIANEPSWFRHNYQDGWNQHNNRLGRWRQEAGELGDLEEPLLALVTREIRRELESRQSRNRSMYWMHHSYCWSEKADVFAQTAEEVYAERKSSGEAVQYIARYLYEGLGQHDRAMEILFIAHAAELLDEDGQTTLVNYLQSRNRHGESIALLLPLVELRPDNIGYRVLLMRAYFHTTFHTTRQDELAATREAADVHFRVDGRWQESAIAALADICRETRLYEHARTYYGEVIPLHQRSQPNRGIGNGTLSQYYGKLAEACAGLDDTPAAVDAACQAVVSWGPRHDNRQSALNSLKSVIQDATDLDAFVVEFDAQVAETKLDNHMVRKALGQVYLERDEFDKALVQLRLAVALQPNDPDIHAALVGCFDGRQDAQGAVGQRIASLQLSRRDIELYKDLGRRLVALEQPLQAERAYTSLVEMLPHESEGHAALAEIRQTQNRWADAADHWRQVAEIRALEPTGLVRLAEAQIQLEQWDEALATLRKLDTTVWPSRFGNIHDQVRNLEGRIEDMQR